MRCFYPQHTKRDKEGNYKVYPCGRCLACRKNDATSWGIRSYFESLSHQYSTFLTVTYDDDHLLPSLSPRFAGSLSIPDHQDFIKRLRYYCGTGVRFLVGAEYGDTTNRPHMHYLIFGVAMTDPIFYDAFYSSKKKGWIARCKAWDKGECFIRPLDVGSCFYTSKYSLKYSKDDYVELKAVKQQLPFRLMSKHPGIGYEYFLKEKDRIMTDGFIRFKGSKIGIPRYFYDKALPPGSKERENYSYNRSLRFKAHNKDDFLLYSSSVGRGKPYLTWTELYNALGDQQTLNMEKKV
uniref:Replication initiator protein n=1 Tax=Dulem virus 94 TaxID=3145805 RepID=A0AAU8B4N2_9VIRU